MSRPEPGHGVGPSSHRWDGYKWVPGPEPSAQGQGRQEAPSPPPGGYSTGYFWDGRGWVPLSGPHLGCHPASPAGPPVPGGLSARSWEILDKRIRVGSTVAKVASISVVAFGVVITFIVLGAFALVYALAMG